jgi:aspartyl/asparaginyl beta-hydroxylase (cupin superfamily)
MSKVFWVTGAATCTLLFLCALLLLILSPPLRWVLCRPALLPFTQVLAYWCLGWTYTVLAALGVLPERVMSRKMIQAFRTARLRPMKELRDVQREVDRLPTIVKGKRALRLKSIFDPGVRRVRHVESEYTHPLQTPPYYLPGVPAKAFYDPGEFEWVAPLQAAFPTIRRELLQLLERDGEGFQKYMNESDQRMAGWNTFNFFFFGEKFEENCRLCPETTAVLESLPRFEKDHIMFSALNPHARIPPHTGPMNGIIRAHLPLIVPDGCYIKVGDDERTWEEGKVLIFDDSFVHQVWNHSDEVRIVLFLNFWHPCFSPEEIAVLERFRSAYEQAPPARVHAANQAQQGAHDLEP